MNYTFFLKHSQRKEIDSNKPTYETLILFSCYFKYESKKFVYSTGEKINPKNWNKEAKYPIERGKNKDPHVSSITMQLDRYKNTFKETEANCIKTKEEFTSKLLKNAFDIEFKKVPTGKNVFFEAYDEFVETKKKEWSKATVKRYNNVKNLLKDFEKEENYKITFNKLNDSFDTKFYNYCIYNRKHPHIDNTYSRNLGFLISFLHWAVKMKYTYNLQYKEFYRPKEVAPEHSIMGKKDLEVLISHKCKTTSQERVRDVFVFACMTGMRFSELNFVNKENVIDGHIRLKEQKETSKDSRDIPLNDLSSYILKKYNYHLPLITNQKNNEVIKDVLKDAGFTQLVEKITIRENKIIREKVPFYERISMHSARRSFVTIMKENEIPDKLIAKITGHKDLKTLNKYYQVREKFAKKAVVDTFNIDFPR